MKRLKRAVERSKLDRKTNIELVETMWEQFCITTRNFWRVVNLTLEVTYIEDVAITGGVLYELGGTLTISDKDGHVFVG